MGRSRKGNGYYRMMELHLPAVRSSPSVARAQVAGASSLSAFDGHLLALLTSELVSNAVLHAGMASTEDIVVKVVDGDSLRVEVIDEGPGFDPTRRRTHAGPKGGFGLRFVDQLAARWGTEREDGHNKVWFELDR
jgi:anti-sigma regulatory factor (Ser/Thr protein kinase)